jgi:toxin ParE1/3/4
VKEAIFHPEARAEMNESRDFYEARLDGLGLRFLSAVEQTVDRISTHPEAGAPLAGEFRKRIISGFPYNIIYRVWQDYIYLIAVAHHSRRPSYWRERADRRQRSA